MPELDGFELASLIREHPRCQRTAIIFISAVLLTDLDRMKGYDSGAVDYVSVPIVPEILRAKVNVFVDLYRKTRELERLNQELERRGRATRDRASSRRPTAGRTSSSRCSRTSCATRSRRSGTAAELRRGSRVSPAAQRASAASVIERQVGISCG